MRSRTRPCRREAGSSSPRRSTLREEAEQPMEARLRVATGVAYAKGDLQGERV
jgi:hypothetical protein